jgi:uncharacterized cupredoxin-like copper-binding protein
MNSSKTHLFLAALAAVLVLGAPARAHTAHGGSKAAAAQPEQKDWGIAGDPKRVSRTIEIRMGDDMRFTPSQIKVRLGQTVRLVAVNRGRLMHEIVIGTPDELRAHAQMMEKHPNMEHDEPYMAHVGPGQRGQIVWTFNRPGTFEFACLIPGHIQAGMMGKITVE